MNLVVVLVGLGEVGGVQEQPAKTVGVAQLELRVHLDGLKGTDLDTNLAAHADGDVDIKNRRVELRFADVVGFLVLALLDVDALRRTFFFTNLAGDTAQAGVGIVPVKEEERELARGFRKREALLRILDGREPRLVGVAADEVSRRLDHALKDAGADHGREVTGFGLPVASSRRMARFGALSSPCWTRMLDGGS